jgi:hypothetical protein
MRSLGPRVVRVTSRLLGITPRFFSLTACSDDDGRAEVLLLGTIDWTAVSRCTCMHMPAWAKRPIQRHRVERDDAFPGRGMLLNVTKQPRPWRAYRWASRSLENFSALAQSLSMTPSEGIGCPRETANKRELTRPCSLLRNVTQAAGGARGGKARGRGSWPPHFPNVVSDFRSARH